ncbi:DUF258 family protein [Medicago truncatula]|uniref:DUF258 family protein n=1 Tax=Medicago truncatula TaxID=3880 RepID=G7JC13_MEDTR|nr:DUF258 family protein [Medicago truncatula]
MELLIEFSNTSLRAILVLVILQMGKIGSKWYDDQRVAEVSTRSGRRKHTTHHVSPLPLSGGGSLADTPGFNQPSLLKVTKQSIAQTFPEVSISCTNSCNKLRTGDMGSQQAEPRLVLKKHRRQSRKKTNQSILDDLDDDDNLLDEENDPLLNALRNENP